MTGAYVAIAISALLQIPSAPKMSVHFNVEEINENKKIHVRLVTPVCDSSSPLAKLVNSEMRRVVRADLPEFLRAARVGDSMIPNDATLFLEVTPVVSVANKRLVSIYVKTFTYTGGAHPNTTYECYTYGYRNGQPTRLSLKDFIPHGSDPLELANRLLIPRLKSMGAAWFVEGSRTSLEPEEVNRFVVTPAGLTWIFPPYAAGPYVQGAFFVKVPWDEITSKPHE